MPPESPRSTDHPPICDYEGSDYQQRFWETGERQYEDQVEAIALKRLLPKSGKLLLEIGAGAGRNTARYANFDRIVLLDYSTTQLEQARERLGDSEKYTYVAANVYRLPFVVGLFDTATMIRVIHHMADAPKALKEIHQVMESGGKFILEYANKRNLKAIVRYWLGKQEWDPFDQKPVEFVPLNFDFHPKAMDSWLQAAGFSVKHKLTVSHFRMGWAKRSLPLKMLVGMDSLLQPTGKLWQFTPSVFLRAEASKENRSAEIGTFFKCPECNTALPERDQERLTCPGCGRQWEKKNGIYNFKENISA